ncbi:MAG: hypothetical protein KAQ78_10750 [Candidatus Latescibacteria bacterium]|nr:hypothetical protein [Candidatus Latescibacterota bacterium]
MANGKHAMMLGLCALFLLIFWPQNGLWAGVHTIGTEEAWGRWTLPNGTPLSEAQLGVVRVTNDGRIELVRTRKHTNTCLNATQFTHRSAEHPGRTMRGGIKEAASNAARAEHIIDGDPDTWWGPNESDALQKWWVEIDLGRAVSATKLRLIFADSTETDALPFEQFTVYVSDGARIAGALDMFYFSVAGRTTKPNRERVVEYELGPGSSGVQSGYGLIYTPDAQIVQYIRIVCDAKSPRPGLAEVEVWALGDNLALGTIERGGYWTPGTGLASSNVYDGDIVSSWNMMRLTETTWESGGAYFVWDLGALFWIDTIQILTSSPDFMARIARRSENYIEGYIFKSSDGSRTPDGKIDYEIIADVSNQTEPYQNTFKHTFDPRLARYLFMRHAHGTGNKRSVPAPILEVQIYGDGYPASVTLESDLMDLGKIAGDQEAKNITHLSWDADLPSGTWIEMRSTSGDSLIQEFIYYDSGGMEISRTQWEKTPQSRRGPKVTIEKPGNDWSPWSSVYRYSGEPFLSPSPRRYVKFQMKLRSQDSDAAPCLKSVSLHFTDPFVQRIFGEIGPSETPADRDTIFSYRILPTYAPGNAGFNKVLILTPTPVDSMDVALRINDAPTSPRSVEVRGDSLFVTLPRTVRRERVEVAFVTRVFRNTTLVEAFVGNTSHPEIWQRVDARERGATTVSLPSHTATTDLIGNLAIEPKVLTPNGDGVGDRALIRFSVFKTERTPEVTVHRLSGEKISTLTCQAGIGRTYSTEWDGRDDSGEMVPPGVYLCRIRVDANAGRGMVIRTIGVVF